MLRIKNTVTRIRAVYRIRFQWIFPVELLLSAGRREFWRRVLAQQKVRQNGPAVHYMILLLWYGRIPWILRPRPPEFSASVVISFVHSAISKPIFRFVCKWAKQYPYNIMYRCILLYRMRAYYFYFKHKTRVIFLHVSFCVLLLFGCSIF